MEDSTQDPKILFADTTARRAQLMAATENFKTSLSEGIEDMKEEASALGKTVAIVAGAGIAVYLVANAILPKSEEYRFAEKYGEPDDDDYDDEGNLIYPTPSRTEKKVKKEATKTGAVSGIVSGVLTTVLTNLAKNQLNGFIDRIRSNNAINPDADIEVA